MSFSSSLIPCPVEKCMVKNSKKQILRHLRQDHPKSGFIGHCKLNQCHYLCSNVSSFEKHLVRWHQNQNVISNTCDIASASENVYSHDTGFANENIENGNEFSRPNTSIFENSEKNVTGSSLNFKNFAEHMVLFCLKLKEKYVLSHESYTSIMNDLINLFSKFHRDILNFFDPKPFMPNAQEYLRDENYFSTLWNKLQKKSFFEECCKSVGLISPIRITLDQHADFQYIPILPTLTTYLSHEDVQKAVLQNSQCDSCSSNQLCSFSDGEFFKTHSYFKSCSSLARIHLYCDELEVCNPVGASKVKHKLACFYFYLGNIGSKHFSVLRNIFPVLLIESKKLKQHGYKKVLEPLIKDIKNLENSGIAIVNHKNGQTFQMRGTIASVSADNLGAHDLGGFSKCFSSGRICRHCKCTYDEMKVKLTDSEFTLRTPENHIKHVDSVERDFSLRSAYGVNHRCALMDVDGFSPVNSFPPDVMHDCFEGVIPYFLQYMVQTLSNDGFSISDLNQKFREFEFGITERKNIPKSVGSNLIQASCKISASASEFWCIFRLLTIIIGSEVSQTNKVWKMYLLLADIMDLILAPKVDVSNISHLSILIQNFLYSFSKAAPDFFKPKFHYLLHYPRLILKYVPLRNVWCMRFESFHQKIKKIVKNTQCFKNLELTVACRLQGSKCFEQYETTCLNDKDEFNGSNGVSLDDLPPEVASFLMNNFEFYNEALFTLSSMTVNGVAYKPHIVYILDISEHDIPTFGLVKQLLLCGDQVLIVCVYLKPLYYDAHMHSYVVDVTDELLFLQPGFELDHHPLDIYHVNDRNYIRMRYNICNPHFSMV